MTVRSELLPRKYGESKPVNQTLEPKATARLRAIARPTIQHRRPVACGHHPGNWGRSKQDMH
eukprot:scaffold18338_cov122-Isochrysis_galbana.AAC.7